MSRGDHRYDDCPGCGGIKRKVAVKCRVCSRNIRRGPKFEPNHVDVRDGVAYMDLVDRAGNQVAVTLIDEADLVKAMSLQLRWSAVIRGDDVRVIASKCCAGKKSTIQLHRFLMDAPDGMHVDHINQNPLDNRRKNLRIVTGAQNQQNTRRFRRSKDLPKGVRRCAGKYRVTIGLNGRIFNFGSYDTAEEAIAVADAKRKEMHEYGTQS